MRRRPTTEHQDTVSRRLALLSEQLAAARDETVSDTVSVEPAPAVGGQWWDDHTRVSPARAPLRVVPEPVPDVPPGAPDPPLAPTPPAPVLVPEPGRHAARRSWAWGELLPATLRGRAGLGAGPVAVVAVLVAVALALTSWQVLRDDPAPPVAVSTTSADQPAALVPVTGAEPEPASPPAATTVTVDVAGRVRRPGIVVLDAGARVVDALDEAGGARPGVDLSSINLARVLVDGEQILVGVAGSAAAPPVVGAPPDAAPAALVDLNLADQALLETLPDVGPVTAAAIVAWRTEHGGFTAVTELLEVDGIGDATLATLTPLVTV